MTSVLSYNTESIKNRGEIENLNFKIKKKNCEPKYYKESEKTVCRVGKKHLQIIYLVSVWYPEFMRNSYNYQQQ